MRFIATHVSLAITEAKLAISSIRKFLGDGLFAQDAGDPEHPYIDSGNCYEWYYALGQYYRPSSICEIGVRLGYSLAAICAGSCQVELNIVTKPRSIYALGLDMEIEVANSNRTALTNFEKVSLNNCDIDLFSLDSRKVRMIADLTGSIMRFDLFHIDGDHSFHGVLHDLMLAWACSKVVVVDDYDFIPEVRRAVLHFLDGIPQDSFSAHYLPSFRGALIIELHYEDPAQNEPGFKSPKRNFRDFVRRAHPIY